MKYLKKVSIILFIFLFSYNLEGQHGWTIDPAKYEYDGEVNAIVLRGSVELDTGFIGAFVGSTCRGLDTIVFNPITGNTICFIRCYSNVVSGETLTFRYFDPLDKSYHDLVETVEFVSNMVVGNAQTPFSFHIFVCDPVSIGTNPSNTSMCEDGGSASFSVLANGTTPFVYQWQYLNGSTWENVVGGSPAGAVYTGTSTATLGVSGITSSGSYQYHCQISNCSSANNVISAPATLTVNALPAKPSITTSGPIAFCTGGNVTLTSSAGTAYLWSNGATTQSINVTTSGSYTVMVTDSNGCQSPASDPVVVTVNALPEAPTITASGATTFCAGGSVTLTSSAGTTWLWSTGATTQSINVSTPGSYTVRVTNSSGCQSPVSSATEVTVNPLPGVNAGIDANIPNGTSTTLNGTVSGTGPFTFSWAPASLLVNAAVEDPVTVNLTSTTTFNFTATINATGCSNTDAVTISVTGGALNATPTATPGTICAGESVQLDAVPSGGSGTYTYLWSSVPAGFSSALSKPVATPSISTTYLVAVNDGFSTVNRQVSVTVNPLPARPTITPSGPTTFCSGSSVTLISSAGTTYLWSTGATTQSINVTSSGIYSVSITNANGCESTISDPVTVTVNPLPATPTITATGVTTFCAGGSVTLTSSAGTTYLWSTGATTPGININTPGSYTVRVTNSSGCQSPSSAATVVTVNPLPGVNAGSDANIPNGTSTTLNGTVTGTGPFTYSWTPASLLVNGSVEDPVTVNLTSTTTFNFTATINATGCSNSDNVTISVTGGALNASPTATPGIICAGETVQLDAAASGGSGTYSYSWTSVPAGFTSALAKPTASPSVNITYYVAVNDGFSTVNRQVAVTVNSLPAKPAITTSGPTTFCTGGNVTLTSSAGTTYLWSTGATTQSINVTTSGSYTVWIINASGCQSPASDPVIVTVNTPPAAPTITASGPVTFCAGGSVTLTSSSATTYLWSTGATTQSINVTTPGSYTVRVTNASGCQSPASTATVVTVNPLPGVNAGSDVSIANGTSTTLNGTVTGTGPFTYSWTPASLLVNATVEDPVTVNLTSNTTFTFTATITATGCSNSDNVTISVSGGGLNATPSATPGTICAGESIQLDAAASGGSGTYTYLWSSVPAGFTSILAGPTATPSVSTVFYVAVNDGFSTINRQVAVTVNPLPARPSITPSGPVTFCAGGSVSLTSSSATTYLWSTGATTRSINVTASGNYTVKVTNSSGCESQLSEPITLTVIDLPSVPTISASGPTTICAGGSVTLTSSPGATYLWSTGATTQNINVTTAGSYTVRIANSSGCQSPSSTSTAVTVNPNPGVNAGIDASIPNGTSTTLNGTVTGTGPFTYSWTPASLLVNATVVDPVTVNLTSTTTFILTATITATGCSASDAVTVTVTGGSLNANPTATPGSVCAGSNVQLDAAASGGSGTYTYSWTSVPAGFTSTVARPLVTPEVNTTYTVVVNDGFNTVGRQVPVTVNAIPADPSITASGPLTFCIGGNVTLTSSSSTNYLWSTGATSRSITVTTSGIYSVRVRNAAGCLSEPSPSTTVTVRPLPAAPLIDSTGHPTCTSATGSVRLAGLPETGIWTLTRYAGGITTTGSGTIATVTGLSTGTYNFTVRDESGCTSLVSSNVIINSQPPTPSAPVAGAITHPTYTVPTGSVVLTGLPTPGTWRLTRNPDGAIINGSGSSRTVSGLEPGTYTFTVTNAVGCTSASSASVLINARPGPPTVIITNPDTICSISTADLTLPAITTGSDPNLTFSYWMDADTTQRISTPSAVPPGIYYIKGSTTAKFYTIKPVTVTADQMPTADAGPDQVLEYTFTTTMDGLVPEHGSGLWSVETGTGTFESDNNAKSKVTELSLGRNEFTWTVTNGVCPSVSDKVIVQVNDLIVPTLITPNRDGMNDFFILRGIENLGKTELTIFDRRGFKVFETKNYQNDWEGLDYDGNELPEDTYFWTITSTNGKSLSGFVVIRR